MESAVGSNQAAEFDYLFKLLMIGDSGVGKSSLLLSFTSDSFEDLSPTIGVDFKVKYVTLGGKKLKLAIWDTAGQERFRTLTSSYYRGAQGIIMVYDVTRRETFTNLCDVWAKEIELYSTNQDCIKMLVGNKVDKESDRVVTKKEGINFARESGCLFIECSAKTRVNVQQCFEELVLKILDTPSLLAEGSKGVKKNNIFKEKPPQSDASTSGSNNKVCKEVHFGAIWSCFGLFWIACMWCTKDGRFGVLKGFQHVQKSGVMMISMCENVQLQCMCKNLV